MCVCEGGGGGGGGGVGGGGGEEEVKVVIRYSCRMHICSMEITCRKCVNDFLWTLL